jgi:hypothetical protein
MGVLKTNLTPFPLQVHETKAVGGFVHAEKICGASRRPDLTRVHDLSRLDKCHDLSSLDARPRSVKT